jgi:hypothetical protein
MPNCSPREAPRASDPTVPRAVRMDGFLGASLDTIASLARIATWHKP